MYLTRVHSQLAADLGAGRTRGKASLVIDPVLWDIPGGKSALSAGGRLRKKGIVCSNKDSPTSSNAVKQEAAVRNADTARPQPTVDCSYGARFSYWYRNRSSLAHSSAALNRSDVEHG